MVMKRRVPGILENLLKNKEETRYANLAYVSIVLLTILSFRLFFMQIIEGSYYKQEADGNRIRTLPIIASRGVMYDRNGILMVGSRASYGITMPVDRKKNSLPEIELRNLADLLKTSPAMLQKKIEDNKAIFGAIYLAKDVSLDVATEIEEKKNDYPDIEVEVQPVRVYPFGNAGAQMLGYVGEAGPEDVDKNGRPYASSTLIGRAGLEWQYNQYLEGTNGSKVIEVNAAGQPVNYTGGAAAISGNNIRLTVFLPRNGIKSSIIKTILCKTEISLLCIRRDQLLKLLPALLHWRRRWSRLKKRYLIMEGIGLLIKEILKERLSVG